MSPPARVTPEPPVVYKHGEEFQITVRRIGSRGCYTNGWVTMHMPDCPWWQKRGFPLTETWKP